MEWVLISLALICAILGVIGSILPGLPGTPLSYVGVWLFHFSDAYNKLGWFAHIVLAIAVITSIVLDYIVPMLGTKKFGGSKYGVWGSTLGLVIGLFFGLPGVILGPLIGAFIFELISQRNASKALKAAIGSFIGFLVGTGIKTIIALMILGFLSIKTFTFVAHVV